MTGWRVPTSGLPRRHHHRNRPPRLRWRRRRAAAGSRAEAARRCCPPPTSPCRPAACSVTGSARTGEGRPTMGWFPRARGCHPTLCQRLCRTSWEKCPCGSARAAGRAWRRKSDGQCRSRPWRSPYPTHPANHSLVGVAHTPLPPPPRLLPPHATGTQGTGTPARFCLLTSSRASGTRSTPTGPCRAAPLGLPQLH